MFVKYSLYGFLRLFGNEQRGAGLRAQTFERLASGWGVGCGGQVFEWLGLWVELAIGWWLFG